MLLCARQFAMFGATVVLACTLVQSVVAEGVQLQVLRQQAQQMEQLGMVNEAKPLHDLIRTLEQEEAAEAASGQAQPDRGLLVRPSYFAQQGQMALEKCASGERQFDTICLSAMRHYQDYLLAASQELVQDTQDDLWRRHAETAKVYMHSLGAAGSGLP